MKNSKILIDEFENGKYDKLMESIYVDCSKISAQRIRYAEALSQYRDTFGDGEVEIYSAPGRCEVGGNHTDHQKGMVLATSINLDVIAIAGYNDENCINILSEGHGSTIISLDDLELKEEEAETSKALVRGMMYGLRKQGFEAKGFNAYLTSDVLGGSGLSSSAAFEVVVGTIVSGLFHQMEISPIEIAQIGQFAENVYFKKPSGLMDQMACSIGGLIHIDFKDSQNPIVHKLNVDFESFQYSLCIVDTKGSHADLTKDYAAVPKEMKAVASYFGKTVLREVEEQKFYEKIPNIRKELGDRPVLRAIHFYKEEKAVLREVEALKNNQFSDFLHFIKESGNSSFQYLQNVYTTQDVVNQGMSIALATSETFLESHGESRVHGGGFAGTILSFVENDFVENYKRSMDSIFGKGAAQILRVRQFGGMKVL